MKKNSSNSITKYLGNFRTLILIGAVVGCGIRVGNPIDDQSDEAKKNQQSRKGSISFDLTDAAIDQITSVFVRITGLAIKNDKSGKWTKIPNEITSEVDLLTLRNGKTIPFGKLEEIAVGTYSEIRLTLDKSDPGYVIDDAGKKFKLKIPAGGNKGLSFKKTFTVSDSTETNIVIDFDVRKSISVQGPKSNPKGYMLKPTLRAVERSNSGNIEITSGTDGDIICIYKKNSDFDTTRSCENSISSAIFESDLAIASFIPFGNYHVIKYSQTGEYEDLGLVKVEANKP